MRDKAETLHSEIDLNIWELSDNTARRNIYNNSQTLAAFSLNVQ